MKILILDIETSPMLAFIWKMFKENVSLDQLIENSYIMSFAAKWWGQDEVIYHDNRKAYDLEKDKSIIRKMHKLIDEADLIVGHNAKDFDLRVFNARCFAHDINPPSPYKVIDTKLVAKRHFRFPSYKLEYLTKNFNKKYKKLDHNKFPGFKLWRAIVIDRDVEAWNEMQEYNIYDVLATEELYFDRLIKWDTHTNFFCYQADQSLCVCGSNHIKRKGFQYTTTGCYQRYKCCSCGRHWRSTKSLNRARFTNAQRG